MGVGFLSGETSPLKKGTGHCFPVLGKARTKNFLGKAIIEPPFREWKSDLYRSCGVFVADSDHYLCY